MRKAAAAIAAICFVLGASQAMAGVVITEQENITGLPQPRALTRTVMIQGNKEKMLSGEHDVITDLDKGVVYSVNNQAKTYTEMPFPPQGAMAKAMGGPKLSAINFTKTGKGYTVAGYKCEEYTGSGKFSMGEFSVVSCVSTGVPGAGEFSKFQKNMSEKLKGTSLAIPEMPEGVPLMQNTTTKVIPMDFPNMPPDQAAKLKEQMRNHAPIVNKTEVTKIAAEDLPADTFTVPAGYKKTEPMMMAPGHPASGGAQPPAGN